MNRQIELCRKIQRVGERQSEMEICVTETRNWGDGANIPIDNSEWVTILPLENSLIILEYS